MAADRSQRDYWKRNKRPRSPHHPVSRSFSEQRWEFLQRFIDLGDIASVLDVGCGKGLASAYLENTHCWRAGIDFSLQQLQNNPIPGLYKAVAVGEGIPFPANSFDLVMTWEVLHHVDNPSLVVSEMARVSRKWLVIFEPNVFNPGQFLFSALIWAERGTFKLRRSIVDKALESSGFEVIFFGRAGWILPNKMPFWLSRILQLFPFRFPVLGVSRLWIARQADQ
jgi:SAM-dependent methyltransferase